jgi:hypothetical protein
VAAGIFSPARLLAPSKCLLPQSGWKHSGK